MTAGPLQDQYSALPNPSQRYYARKKAKGWCVWSGCNEMAAEGRTMCLIHGAMKSKRVCESVKRRKANV